MADPKPAQTTAEPQAPTTDPATQPAPPDQVTPDQIEELFVGEEQPEGGQAPAPEVTLRKQRRWGERFVAWLQRAWPF